MDGAGAVLFEHFEVELSAIAFVTVKAVHRIFFVEFEHEPVAGDLGYDGRGHALENGSVCPYNSFLGYGEIDKKVPIDDQKIYLRVMKSVRRRTSNTAEFLLKIPYCFNHGEFGRLEDIDFVDHFFGNLAYSPCNFRISVQFRVNTFSLYGRK